MADEAAAVLARAGQEHLLDGLDDAQRQRLLAQVRSLDAAYGGGLEAYVSNARRLLAASKAGENPLDGLTPSVPIGERLEYGSKRHASLEEHGLREVGAAAFVLVAGGLGERLGFPGIKLRLSVTATTGWTYLEYYCRFIRALQQGADAAVGGMIPFVIMTSDDTHAPTAALLEESDYFGLARKQVHILKQEKVACLMDSEARLAKDPKDPALIETKPHGHGDVHSLLHSSGLAKRFLEEGRRWIIFFQDTNGLFFRALPATLGISAESGLAMNSVAVPRLPKDAMGGIAKLTRADGSSLTASVEYNQLDPLLRATTFPDGDVADETGYSPFPGNMNSLVLALDTYASTLERTKGVIAEFVNPKYADSARTAFKSSTRLECMMQDFPHELPADAKVGFTMFDSWCSYSPVKNSPSSAVQKFKDGHRPQSATTGETDLFAYHCRVLRLAGAEVEAAQRRTFSGIEVDLEPMVVWSPQWAVSFVGIRERLAPGAKLSISQRSALVLDGDISIEELTVDGALVVRASPGCRVRIRRLNVRNAGWQLEPVDAGEADPETKMKGFRIRRKETRELAFEAPGEHVVDEPPALKA
mmetsp:Transcript_101101/g.290997  ORF Transcript_101101/g.290997 Transcript_101101/m.290997 type:complete len:588 (+) Transcript_101101:118-1881(+)